MDTPEQFAQAIVQHLPNMFRQDARRRLVAAITKRDAERANPYLPADWPDYLKWKDRPRRLFENYGVNPHLSPDRTEYGVYRDKPWPAAYGKFTSPPWQPDRTTDPTAYADRVTETSAEAMKQAQQRNREWQAPE